MMQSREATAKAAAKNSLLEDAEWVIGFYCGQQSPYELDGGAAKLYVWHIVVEIPSHLVFCVCVTAC